MNKKLILILICLTSFGTAFAQIPNPPNNNKPTDFTDSAKNKATAGQFNSDSDNVSADDIFDVERTFFSAGYQPSLNLGSGAGTLNTLGTMTGFWAMPINDTMTVGIAGEYSMAASINDTSTLSPTTPTIPNGIFTQSELTENSSFNIRPVFKFGDFAFHYRIYRSGEYKSIESKTTIIPSGTEILTNGNYVSGTFWEHEIGFAWQTDMFKLYVPIGAVINMKNDNTFKYDGTGLPGLAINTTTKNADETQAYLYLNPEISFPVEIGPITEFKGGINFSAAIYNPSGAAETITVNSGTSITGPAATKETKIITTVEDQSDIEGGVFFQTTMEWKTWEDKIDFILQPTIGVDYRHVNNGRETTKNITIPAEGDVLEVITLPYDESTYYDRVTPYLKADIGSTIRFTEWFEWRAGLAYGLNWENTTTTVSYKLQDGGKVSTLASDFKSTFEIYSGFGFIIVEDFFIDIYIAAGNVQNDNAFQGPATALVSYDLFDIRNYGVQLSYRF